jgi:YggT family protein
VSFAACQLAQVLNTVVLVYTIILLIYAVVSWIPDLRGQWVYYLARVVDPVLVPIRRIIPPIGGLDLAFLVLILILNFLVRPALASLIVNACYR